MPDEPEVTLSRPAKQPPEDDRVEAEEPAAGEPSAHAADAMGRLRRASASASGRATTSSPTWTAG